MALSIVGVVARVLSFATSVYMLLCMLRVFMSWMPGFALGRAGRIISSLVDPFLGLFARSRLFRSDRFDFSPVIALSVLSVLNRLFTTMAYTGRFSVGLLASLVLAAAWSAVSFIVSFLAVCAFLRLVVFAFRFNSFHPLWTVVDAILNPALYRINKLLYRGRPVPYLQGLITGLIVLFLMRAAGGALIGVLNRLLISLPF